MHKKLVRQRVRERGHTPNILPIHNIHTTEMTKPTFIITHSELIFVYNQCDKFVGVMQNMGR